MRLLLTNESASFQFGYSKIRLSHRVLEWMIKDYHLSRLRLQHLVVDLQGRLNVLHLHGHVVDLVGDLRHLVPQVVAQTLHILAAGILRCHVGQIKMY